MQQVIQKWGNSLAIRIPKNLALDSNIDRGSVVDMSINNGQIVLKPIQRTKYSLEQLLAKISNENKHDETNTGYPSGKEIW